MTRTVSRKRRPIDRPTAGAWSPAPVDRAPGGSRPPLPGHDFAQLRVSRPARACGLPSIEGTGVQEEDDRGPGRDARPHDGSATIVCDGSGGYRVALNSWAGGACGIEGCVRRHEESHATDWRRRWPNGCKDKANGADIPLGGPGYADFLKTSECTAYGVEESCIAPLLAAAARDHTPCEATLRSHLADTRTQKASFC
jgi:hypothetical protein